MDFNNIFDSNSITNEELIAEFGQQLESGKVVVIFAKPSSNPEFMNVYLAQKANDLSRASATSRVSKASALLKGWSNENNMIIVRAQDNYSVEVLEEMGITQAGVTMDDVMLRVFDTHEAAYEGQTPIVNSRTGEVRLSGGQPIYQQVELVTTEEFYEDGGHNVMKYDAVAVTTRSTRRENVASPGAISGQ